MKKKTTKKGKMQVPFQSTPTYAYGGQVDPWQMYPQQQYYPQQPQQFQMQGDNQYYNQNGNTGPVTPMYNPSGEQPTFIQQDNTIGSTSNPMNFQEARGQRFGKGLQQVGQMAEQALQGLTTGGIQLANALIPDNQKRTTRNYNGANYNQYQMGTGSQAIYDNGGYMTQRRNKGNIHITEEVPMDYTSPVPDNYNSQYLPINQFTPSFNTIPVQQHKNLSYIPGYDATGNLTDYTPTGNAGYSRNQFINDVQSLDNTYAGIPVNQSQYQLQGNYQNFMPNTSSEDWVIPHDYSQQPYTVLQHHKPNEEEFGSGGSIHINPKNKGKFTALKKRTGKTTEELTHSKNPLTRKRAVFAQNAKKFKHENGGMIEGSLIELSPEQLHSYIAKGYTFDFE